MAKKRRKYDKLDNPTRPCPYDKQVQCVQRTGEEVHDWACCQCNTRTKAAESLAQAFHETYERLAPDYSYKTRKASAVQWENVPEPNKSLMIGVAGEILDKRFVLAIDTLAEQLAAKDKDLERLRKCLIPHCTCSVCRPVLERALAERIHVSLHEAIRKAAEKSKDAPIKQEQKPG